MKLKKAHKGKQVSKLNFLSHTVGGKQNHTIHNSYIYFDKTIPHIISSVVLFEMLLKMYNQTLGDPDHANSTHDRQQPDCTKYQFHSYSMNSFKIYKQTVSVTV